MEMPSCIVTLKFLDDSPVLAEVKLTIPYHGWYVLSNSEIFQKVMGLAQNEEEI